MNITIALWILALVISFTFIVLLERKQRKLRKEKEKKINVLMNVIIEKTNKIVDHFNSLEEMIDRYERKE